MPTVRCNLKIKTSRSLTSLTGHHEFPNEVDNLGTQNWEDLFWGWAQQQYRTGYRRQADSLGSRSSRALWPCKDTPVHSAHPRAHLCARNYQSDSFLRWKKLRACLICIRDGFEERHAEAGPGILPPVIPYVDPPKDKNEADMSGAMSSTMPMAAMFTRNRMIGWVSLVFSLQNWLAESPEQSKTASTPAYMSVFMSYPFAEADEDTGETKQSQNYIHIRIQQRNGRKTLTTVQGLPKKFDQKKILKVIKKKFACNGTIVNDTEMGEVIQLQGDQRKDVQEFLTDKKEGLELDAKTIKVHGF
ncbi:hypothetical protein AN4742.2 [Paecilomyces variotii No. 5]|uniref:SUI1 domain-containing protein n=1 Tax=Byssochlamys spectabilis (strain No. 5 / NBRC 109023) TaxID=1356009 RepID=V5FU94_BYSSN|nr:hypothetical protein AN4742.2 [Paecilomyces variotii No. 5]